MRLVALGGCVCLCIGLAAPAVAQLRTDRGHSLGASGASDRLLGDPADDGATAIDEYGGPDDRDPIQISARRIQQWEENGGTVILLRDRCRVTQGQVLVSGRQMVLWQPPRVPGEPQQLVVYAEDLEGKAVIETPEQREARPVLLVGLSTRAEVTPLTTPATLSGEDDPLYARALQRRRQSRRTELQPTQYVVPQSNQPPTLFAPAFPAAPIGPQRRVTISDRFLGGGNTVRGVIDERSEPKEYVITITRGVNIVVDNVPIEVETGRVELTTIDLSADRAVIWTSADQLNQLGGGLELGPNTPFQVYLEGNIVVRAGLNTVRASHAFYDINEERGLLLNAELRTYLPDFGGDLRLRADSIRQNSSSNFHASNAWVTTSQLGTPGYRVQAGDIFLEERHDPTRGGVNPQTGAPTGGTAYLRSLNNQLFVEGFPILSLPYISGPAQSANVPIRNVTAGWDGIFGARLETTFNVNNLFGFDLPPGVDWGLEADIYSERGPGIGTLGNFDADGLFFGEPAHYSGFGNLYYLHDDGEDNLGLGRRDLDAPDNRGRALFRERIDLPMGTWLTGELGYLSDRNFLEQYHETEWDTGKDYDSLLTLNHQIENLTLSGTVRGQINDFNTTTEWLPRGDLSVLSEPLFGGWLTWSSHSSAAFAQVQPAQAPGDPADVFDPLPYYAPVGGAIGMTRHELDMPFRLGPVNVVPYALGEAAWWQEDFTGSQIDRLYGSAGVRASVEFWKAMPEVRSSILGLNGLAHKMIFDVDYYYATSTEDLTNIPQYNEFDDDAQERFRSRFFSLAFGGALPPEFDPRFYAVRSGAGRSVTDPYHELVDDMHVLRMGWRHRWQTKAGPPGRQRIKDWMTLDLESSFFPNPNRDNFGEDLGLFTGRYAWNVGERTTLLANAIYDVFDPGQQLWNVGVLTQRSRRGSLYVGFRQVNAGPIDSQLVSASYSYLMSDKWASTFGTSYDLAEGIDRGQSLTVTRIGEYLLLHVGVGYDRSHNNVGFGISIEPRIGYNLGSTQLSSLLGVPTP